MNFHLNYPKQKIKDIVTEAIKRKTPFCIYEINNEAKKQMEFVYIPVKL